jgi:hypothetical protein
MQTTNFKIDSVLLRLESGSGQVGFVVDKKALGQDIWEYFGFA